MSSNKVIVGSAIRGLSQPRYSTQLALLLALSQLADP